LDVAYGMVVVMQRMQRNLDLKNIQVRSI
jgi:hypothetical protein